MKFLWTAIPLLALMIFFTRCKEPGKDSIENYKQNKNAIYKVADYFNTIQTDCSVMIEFRSDETFDLIINKGDYTQTRQNIFDKYGTYKKSNINVKDLDSPEYQEPLRLANMDKEKLNILQAYLFNANCFSISSKRKHFLNDTILYTWIGFERNPWIGATVYYMIFDEELSDSLIQYYTKYCSYDSLDKDVLIEYSADHSFGNDCFPHKK